MTKTTNRIALLATLALTVVMSTAGLARATTASANITNDLRDQAATAAARDVLIRTDEVLNAITYTYYTSDDYWNDATGVYKTDCSGFTNRVIEDAAPEAYDDLLGAMDITYATAADYYDFFYQISYGATEDGWTRIKQVSSLRPGDVLVWKYDELPSSGATGHVMVVVGMPVKDSRWSNVYQVRVADSAKSGHSTDNRGTTGSGLGAGVILLKVSTTSGAAYQYAWSTKGYWKDDIAIAYARPAN